MKEWEHLSAKRCSVCGHRMAENLVTGLFVCFWHCDLATCGPKCQDCQWIARLNAIEAVL